MEKKLVCQVDGKRFSTKAALTQHRKDAHGSGPPARATQRNPRRAVNALNMGRSAPLSTPMLVRGVQNDVARMSGVDRVYHTSRVMMFAYEEIVCDILVVPAIFPRLKLVSEAFQRIRYLRLEFRVEPQMPTTTSGGYAVAFVRDPADEVATLNALTAQQGSVTTKWWQSSRVSATPPNRLFYTSDSTEVREFSPGRLVIMADGVATQSGSVTVFCDWSVELSAAGYDPPSKAVAHPAALMDLLTRVGHQGLFSYGSSGEPIDDVAKQVAGAEAGKFYKLRFPVTVPSARTSPEQVKVAHYIYCKTANDMYLCYDKITDVDESKAVTVNLVVSKGTLLDDITPPPARGEVQAPPSSDSLTEMAALLLQLAPLRKLFAQPTQQSLPPLISSQKLSMESEECCQSGAGPSGCTGNAL